MSPRIRSNVSPSSGLNGFDIRCAVVEYVATANAPTYRIASSGVLL
jgi:hypothetical protein